LGAPVGLIAGLGRFPLELASAARRRGHRIAAVGFAGLADPGLGARVDVWETLPLGQIARLLEVLRREGVRQVVLAGKVPKRVLFEAGGRLEPDARAVALLRELRDRKDDSILLAVAELLEAEGFELLAQAELAPELLAPEGVLGAVAPTAAQRADVVFAWPIAKALGALDVGQTVVVEGRAVLALEAIEGTDEAIRRGCALGRGGACVVKVAKPGQDPRFDVPAVGLDTLRALRQGGAGLLAVEAGATLLLERAALVAEADGAGIALLGVAGDRLPAPGGAT
jgi:DUF1009 family protein